jgi:hypothetical protein
MFPDLVYKFQMNCKRSTQVIEQKSNVSQTHSRIYGHGQNLMPLLNSGGSINIFEFNIQAVVLEFIQQIKILQCNKYMMKMVYCRVFKVGWYPVLLPA